MSYKKISVSLLLGINISSSYGQNVPSTSNKDFQTIIGNWKGSLTYLDYTTGKPFSMPANLNIKQIGRSNSFSFENLYPKEPNANSVDTLTISKDGKTVDKETVKSREKTSSGNLKIVTEIMGKDGNENKAALIRHTYILGSNLFSITKDVQFVGQTEWVKRHEFSYSK